MKPTYFSVATIIGKPLGTTTANESVRKVAAEIVFDLQVIFPADDHTSILEKIRAAVPKVTDRGEDQTGAEALASQLKTERGTNGERAVLSEMSRSDLLTYMLPALRLLGQLADEADADDARRLRLMRDGYVATESAAQ